MRKAEAQGTPTEEFFTSPVQPRPLYEILFQARAEKMTNSLEKETRSEINPTFKIIYSLNMLEACLRGQELVAHGHTT
jgi:hypothetical protein